MFQFFCSVLFCFLSPMSVEGKGKGSVPCFQITSASEDGRWSFDDALNLHCVEDCSKDVTRVVLIDQRHCQLHCTKAEKNLSKVY